MAQRYGFSTENVWASPQEFEAKPLSLPKNTDMNRIFHARIVPGQYLFLLLVAVLAFWSLWEKNILLAAVCMLGLVFLIERLIHTTYILTTEGTLRIDRGRFSRRRERPLSDIVSVERASSMQVAGHALVRYVLVHYKDGKYDALMPVKEEEFIRLLTKRMEINS